MASIRERNGSYQITVSCGRDINGKKLRETTTFTPDPSLPARKRKQAVERFALEFEQKIENGYSMDAHRMTLKEFSENGSLNMHSRIWKGGRWKVIRRNWMKEYCRLLVI